MKTTFILFQRPRGQPLLVFATLLGGWLVLRVLLWESPFPGFSPALAIVEADPTWPAAMLPARAAPKTAHLARGDHKGGERSRPSANTRPAAVRPPHLVFPRLGSSKGVGRAPDLLEFGAAVRSGTLSASEGPSGVRQSHPLVDQPGLHFLADSTADASSRANWSGDAWLLLRNDSRAPLVSGRPAYGRSQAGAVLRYRLESSSSHRPTAYARVTQALVGAGETEVAAGFAARVLPRIPVSVSAELRSYDSAAGTEIRPAVLAVTELPPAQLGLGLRGEAYVQAGYVGGRFATAFVDGQARIDKHAMQFGDHADLRIAGAFSGGAQEGAERIDLGPGATVSFRLGEVHSRLVLDYRFRVAGDAKPGSGPALTLSAGF